MEFRSIPKILILLKFLKITILVDSLKIKQLKTLFICNFYIFLYTRKDRLRNEVTREKVGVTPTENKMRDNRLTWFGHVRRGQNDAPVRRLEEWQTDSIMRGRGRPKKFRSGWLRLIWVDWWMRKIWCLIGQSGGR